MSEPVQQPIHGGGLLRRLSVASQPPQKVVCRQMLDDAAISAHANLANSIDNNNDDDHFAAETIDGNGEGLARGNGNTTATE